MTSQTPVFVYGTLRTNQGNYNWALHGKTISEQTATLAGALMVSNGGFPFVSMTDATPEDTVTGDLMYINPEHYESVMNSLDGLEGYYGPSHQGNMYDRVLVTVTTDDGTQIEAYTYLAATHLYERRVQFLPRIESGDWLNRNQDPEPRLSGSYGW